MNFSRPQPTDHQARHLDTFVALICGLPGGRHAHLATIADHAPSFGAHQESVISRFRRYLKNDAVTLDGWFLPVARALLATLAQQMLTTAPSYTRVANPLRNRIE